MLGETGSTQTPLEWTADREARAVDTAICAGDILPGDGGFPRTDARELGVVPLLARLPYLFADRSAPAAPTGVTIAPGGAGVWRLVWSPGSEPDLAGYRVTVRARREGRTSRCPRSSIAPPSSTRRRPRTPARTTS